MVTAPPLAVSISLPPSSLLAGGEQPVEEATGWRARWGGAAAAVPALPPPLSSSFSLSSGGSWGWGPKETPRHGFPP